MRAAFLHLPGDRLSIPELAAARLDGDVVELGEAYAPADLVETSALRAASLASLLHGLSDAAFAGMSAAWIHGAGDVPPELHELQSATGRRLRAPGNRRILVHDPVLDPSDIRFLGDVAVTTPARTLIDLLRWPTIIPERRTWAHLLVQTDVSLAADAAVQLSRMHHGPGFQRVAAFLAEHGAPVSTGAARVDGAEVRTK